MDVLFRVGIVKGELNSEILLLAYELSIERKVLEYFEFDPQVICLSAKRVQNIVKLLFEA